MTLRRLWCALALLLFAAAPATAQTFPKFTGLVVDAANVIPDDQQAALEQKLEALQRDHKNQLVVATVPDLQGYPIEDYGYRLGRAWGVGLKDADNGAILIVAPNDRKVRVEVGRGLEPVVTDAYSSVLINGVIIPRFKAGDMAGGIIAGADALADTLSVPDDLAKAKVDAAIANYDKTHRRTSGAKSAGGSFWMVLIPILIVGGFMVFGAIGASGGRGRRYRGDGGGSVLPIVLWSIADEMSRGSHGGSSWGGGSGGGWGGGSDDGGGWGGGGFTGGGGGSFGGGGASGSW